VSVVVTTLAVMGMAATVMTVSRIELEQAELAAAETQAELLAESAVEHGIHFLGEAAQKAGAFDPIATLAALDDGDEPFEPLGPVAATGVRGEYRFRITEQAATPTTLTLTIDGTGYVPAAPENLAPGERLRARRSVRATVLFELTSSDVFDYAYFINNWGWLYGSSINILGNARSNGQMDIAGYSPTITGGAMYETAGWDGANASLDGYYDTNADGLQDGMDGGVYAGWDIVDAGNLQGGGGMAMNQHDFQDPTEMPNLSDLSMYEAQAISEGASIHVAGSPVVQGVLGDDPGEVENLFLEGTAADPIVLDGPVVVQGDVVIKGHVTGQGAIYAGGNIYIPESVTHVNGPAGPPPINGTETQTEAWLSANWDKDFLGLFSAENIVAGDHSHWAWKHYVGTWMSSPLNASAEDSGEDLIPNTIDGKDGIPGTADDDVLENDGVFTIETYTAEDLALGLIPPGKSVGDPIPGTGEDIDGDGEFDDTLTLADVELAMPLTGADWAGNLPAGGVSDYSSIASLYANEIDAVLYTNHSFSWVVIGSQPAVITGSLTSRNENIVYGTPSINTVYDARLLGRASGMAAELLPRTLRPARILSMTPLDQDPLVVAPQP
jgi:hypothetical protein